MDPKLYKLSCGGFLTSLVRFPPPADLVAYWDFNAGVGYTIRDVTNHGHDLIATQRPRWEVVRWLSTCGNGVVEGKEECDDGDLQDGDGCNSVCRIEPGWSCTGHPSKCVQGGGGGAAPKPQPPPGPAPSAGGRGGDVPATAGGDIPPSSGSSGGRNSRRSGSIAAAVLVPVFVLVVFGGLFAYRGAVYEQFPQVEAAVTNLQAAMGGVFKKPDGRYAALALDPEELDISPEFLNPTPARPPGSSGPYSPLP